MSKPKRCEICGERFDLFSAGFNRYMRTVWLCSQGECQMDYEQQEREEEQDAYEQELSDLNSRYGYNR